MATHDYNIANQGFPAFRSDLNNVLSAIVSNNSNSTAPSTTYAYQWWYDVSTTTLKFRNADNDAWISFATFDMANDTVNLVDSAIDVVTDTTPQLGGMLDVNGNAIGNGTEELIKFSETASAVNEITVTNSATGNAPEISATGDDTNIDLKLTPKGSGNLNLDGLIFPNADGTADQVLKTDGSGNLSFVDAGGGGGISWQTVKTTSFTASASEGYFVNTTSGAITATLPASPTQGDEVSFIDYAGTFDTNNLTVGRNGKKIQGDASDLTVATERAGLTLVFVDDTQGWLLKEK